MRGAVIIRNQEKVEIRDFDRPTPGPGQVVLKVTASSICGSDLRAVYRKDAHAAAEAEEYRDVICGHEPAGVVEQVGTGVHRFGVGDRVAVYHIAGCGVCRDCREGAVVTCGLYRRAYGFQRHGGMGEYLLADEQSLIPLPDGVSDVDGAIIACGAGTAYEALLRAQVSGNDRVLITGLGPVGLALGMIARCLGASEVIGVDLSEARVDLARRIGAVTAGTSASGREALAFVSDQTGGDLAEVGFDCSGNVHARTLAVQGTRRWGRTHLVGMGGRLDVDADELIMKQLTVSSSWVTTPAHMEDLCRKAPAWDLHLDQMVTNRLPLESADEAFAIANAGYAGKVCIVPSTA